MVSDSIMVIMVYMVIMLYSSEMVSDSIMVIMVYMVISDHAVQLRNGL